MIFCSLGGLILLSKLVSIGHSQEPRLGSLALGVLQDTLCCGQPSTLGGSRTFCLVTAFLTVRQYEHCVCRLCDLLYLVPQEIQWPFGDAKGVGLVSHVRNTAAGRSCGRQAGSKPQAFCWCVCLCACRHMGTVMCLCRSCTRSSCCHQGVCFPFPVSLPVWAFSGLSFCSQEMLS